MVIESPAAMRIAALEVGATGAANQQYIASEDRFRPLRLQYEAEGFIGMPWGIEGTQANAIDIDDVRPRARGRRRHSAWVNSPINVTHWVAARKSPSAVMWSACVWVSMARTSLEIHLLDGGQILLRLFLDRIDDDRLATATRRQQIGIGTRLPRRRNCRNSMLHLLMCGCCALYSFLSIFICHLL